MSQNAAIFIGNRRALVDYATGLVGSRTLAEDLVQEAWLRFDEAASKQFVREPLGYLYRIVRNLAVDRQRRASRESRIFADIAIEDAAIVSPDRPATPETEALFRDEIFYVDSDSATGGRRVALQEYPKRNTPYAEDMGRTARTFQVQGFLIGPFYHELNDKLGTGLTAELIATRIQDHLHSSAARLK